MPEASVAIQESTNARCISVHEQGFVCAEYENWLQAGFAQAAYMARDLVQYGVVLPETILRTRNERRGIAIEKLGEPYITCFDYSIVDGCLRAEDGESFVPIFSRGYERSLSDARDDPRLNFLVNRNRADVSNAVFLQELATDPDTPIGTTVIINSPCPSASNLGVPTELLEDYNYRPTQQLAVQWIATKTIDGIRLQSSSLFNADPQHLAEVSAVVSRQPVEVSDAESMPWQRTVFQPEPNTDVARQLQMEFDSIIGRETGRQTFHGLESHEQAGVDVTLLVETEEFLQALEASESIIKQISESLVLGTFTVDSSYMYKLLAMKMADGSFELSGKDRDAVMRVLNTSHPRQSDVTAALHIAQKAADAIVWARLRKLSDGEDITLVNNIEEAVHSGIDSVQTQRQQGAVEYGCPGDGPNKSDQKSIFDMSADQLASAFMRKTFITNCPLCEEKNITATQENGTITCGSCSACVEICTGEVIQKSRKQRKAKEASGKLAAKNTGIMDWIMDVWAESSSKQKLGSQKQKSMRR